MRDRKFLISTIILAFLVVLLSSFIIYDKVLKKEEKDNTNDIVDEYDNDSFLSSDGTCIFMRSHHVVDLLENYVGEVPESTLILVDHFQSHYPVVLEIPNDKRDILEINKNYEFIYTIPKNNDFTSEDEILSLLVGNLINSNNGNKEESNVSLTIRESEKAGLELINEEICK